MKRCSHCCQHLAQHVWADSVQLKTWVRSQSCSVTPTLYDRKSLLPTRLILCSFSGLNFAHLHFQKCAYTDLLKFKSASELKEFFHKPQGTYFIIICSSLHHIGFPNWASHTWFDHVYPSLYRCMKSSSCGRKVPRTSM